MNWRGGPKKPGPGQKARADRSHVEAEGLAMADRQAAARQEKSARLRKLREERDRTAKKG